MIYEGFKIHSIEHINEAYCTNKKCKKKPELLEVSNGFLSRSLFCVECKSVYILKLERVPKVNKEYLEQCMDEAEFQKRKLILIGQQVLEKEKRRDEKRQLAEEKWNKRKRKKIT